MHNCCDCHVLKNAAEFYLGGNGKPACVCKECHKARMKRRRMTNPAVQAADRKRYHEPKRKEMSAVSAKRWRENHPEAYKAQTAVNNAVRDGRLAKNICALCASSKNIHAHHKDYSKPLDVVWLCAQCHHRVHATFPELGGHFAGNP
jgi:hypothetical protein